MWWRFEPPAWVFVVGPPKQRRGARGGTVRGPLPGWPSGIRGAVLRRGRFACLPCVRVASCCVPKPNHADQQRQDRDGINKTGENSGVVVRPQGLLRPVNAELADAAKV